MADTLNLFHRQTPIKLRLSRDISKHIKRGNPWVFKDVLAQAPSKPAGTWASLSSDKAGMLGYGFYDPHINLAFRMVSLEKPITDQEIKQRILHALKLRGTLLHAQNQCARLINGEGDLLPGLVVDFYNGTGVLKLDGTASEAFWHADNIAKLLVEQEVLPIERIYYKRKSRDERKGELLTGTETDLTQVRFLENGVTFEANLIDGAKTGFFLDQRENRQRIREMSKGHTVLNLFSYTAGFSVYAGLGGATQVTSVDIAPEAIKAAEKNWAINGLTASHHQAICADVFTWIKDTHAQKKSWDLVIADPPSLAPNKQSAANAKEAYQRVFIDALKLVAKGGMFAASSCSGHVSFEEFTEIVIESIAKSRRRGRVISLTGQPSDHPWPLALSEARYLKFILVQLD